jgi:hypothetical protein
MPDSVGPLHVARLSRRRRVQCPERLGFEAVSYLRCQRRPGHLGKCWAQGWSWQVVGRDQEREYRPSEPAPTDVSAPWAPRRQRAVVRRTGGAGRRSSRPAGHGHVTRARAS